MKIGFIICGALAREVIDIVKRNNWDAEVFGIPALDHMHPDRIAPDVEKRIRQLSDKFDKLVVVFGDCGSRGALDELLELFPQIVRIAGPHCYEMYGGETFQKLMEEEPGTYFLTDFLLRGFDGLVVKGMGLDRYPQLKDDYFRNYNRLVYLAQNPSPRLMNKAKVVAKYLDLPLEIHVTGYGYLEKRLAAIVNGKKQV